MWRSFLALPFVVRFLAWAGAGILTLYAVIKAKAIHAVFKKATDALSRWFWEWVHRKASLGHTPNSNERKYGGEFLDYWYTSTPGPMWFFSFRRDGITTTVRVNQSPMLTALKPGTYVEIETEVRPDHTYESIKRVHVRN